MPNNNLTQNLGDYVRRVFDLNKDGKVTFKEFFSALLPNQAVAIALIVVDLLSIVAEYRVWDVGMRITGDPYKAFGFVLVSGVPFWLAQILWLYPRATTGQQAIAIGMIASSLFTSAQFGLADLSQSYDVARLVQIVIWLTIGYIVALLIYVLIDKSFRLYRASVQAKDNAMFQSEMNEQMDTVLKNLEKSLQRQQELERRYGPEAVMAHLELMGGLGGKGKKQSQNNSRMPEPVNPPIPPRQE
jgi:hypothetical protein